MTGKLIPHTRAVTDRSEITFLLITLNPVYFIPFTNTHPVRRYRLSVKYTPIATITVPVTATGDNPSPNHHIAAGTATSAWA